jgi:hypothetical protein
MTYPGFSTAPVAPYSLSNDTSIDYFGVCFPWEMSNRFATTPNTNVVCDPSFWGMDGPAATLSLNDPLAMDDATFSYQ